jgi:hypothetical protein
VNDFKLSGWPVILKINVALLEGAIAFIVTLTSDILQPRVTLSIVVFLMESPYDRKVARQTACVGMLPDRDSVFGALSSERIGVPALGFRNRRTSN